MLLEVIIVIIIEVRFSVGHNLALKGYLAMSGEVFLVVTLRTRVVTGSWWVEARDVAKKCPG